MSPGFFGAFSGGFSAGGASSSGMCFIISGAWVSAKSGVPLELKLAPDANSVAEARTKVCEATAPDLDVLYVPVGQGSGICGCIMARDLLGLKTEIVGVQSTLAPSYALSFAACTVVTTNSADTNADGLATRSPDADALESYRGHGGGGPATTGLKVCWGADREECVETVYRLWPNDALDGELAQIRVIRARILHRMPWIAFVGIAIVVYVSLHMVWEGYRDMVIDTHVVGAHNSMVPSWLDIKPGEIAKHHNR